jgi:hypothetical protein
MLGRVRALSCHIAGSTRLYRLRSRLTSSAAMCRSGASSRRLRYSAATSPGSMNSRSACCVTTILSMRLRVGKFCRVPAAARQSLPEHGTSLRRNPITIHEIQDIQTTPRLSELLITTCPATGYFLRSSRYRESSLSHCLPNEERVSGHFIEMPWVLNKSFHDLYKGDGSSDPACPIDFSDSGSGSG